MDNSGNIGVGTNIKFAFTYGNNLEECKVMIAEPSDQGLIIRDFNPILDEID